MKLKKYFTTKNTENTKISPEVIRHSAGANRTNLFLEQPRFSFAVFVCFVVQMWNIE